MKRADPIPQMFLELPDQITRWLLDTNVWGLVVESEKRTEDFVTAFLRSNQLAGLTVYSLFELSRAARIVPLLDDLFYRLRHSIWMPLLYDYVYQRELDSYPDRMDISWMPLSLLTGEEEDGPPVMSKFAHDPRFISSREEHTEFGFQSFMSLDEFKQNFPKSETGDYAPKDALEFSRLNALDYFRRRDPSFLRRHRSELLNFDPRGIPSQFARSILLFYKFYVHGKSPISSDFLDFANASYLPYCDIFVTERDVLNTLRHIRTTTEFMPALTVQHVTDFVQKLPALHYQRHHQR